MIMVVKNNLQCIDEDTLIELIDKTKIITWMLTGLYIFNKN